MKKGYWVLAYRRVADEATMKNYLALAGAALGLFGGAAVGVAAERGYGSRGWVAADDGRG